MCRGHLAGNCGVAGEGSDSDGLEGDAAAPGRLHGGPCWPVLHILWIFHGATELERASAQNQGGRGARVIVQMANAQSAFVVIVVDILGDGCCRKELRGFLEPPSTHAC